MGDLQKSKRLRREAGEWLEEAENELKQEVGRAEHHYKQHQFFRRWQKRGRESEMGLMKYRSEMDSPLHQGRRLELSTCV